MNNNQKDDIATEKIKKSKKFETFIAEFMK